MLLAVKPQAVQELLEEIRGELTRDQVVISVVASVTTAFLERNLNAPIPVIRAMPNTPCLVRSGMTALCKGIYAEEQQLKEAQRMFDSVGRTLILDEKYMDAVTGLSASGPAFMYIIIESLAEAGVKVGLPRSVATELAAQMTLGSAKMVLETREHPALLKDIVTTPAGCTIDGILELEEGQIARDFDQGRCQSDTESVRTPGELNLFGYEGQREGDVFSCGLRTVTVAERQNKS